MLDVGQLIWVYYYAVYAPYGNIEEIMFDKILFQEVKVNYIFLIRG